MKHMLNKNCKRCGKTFETYDLQQKYCSRKCARNPDVEKICPMCKKVFYISKSAENVRHCCSMKCRNKSYIGKFNGTKSNSWRGGKLIKSQLYILIYSPNHPHKTKGNYVYEHRLVMEKHIGRYLKPTEIVHHINGNKHDNRIENLKLFANESDHRNHHPLVHDGNPKHLKTLTI